MGRMWPLVGSVGSMVVRMGMGVGVVSVVRFQGRWCAAGLVVVRDLVVVLFSVRVAALLLEPLLQT